MTKDEALKLALDALEESNTNNDTMEFHDRKNKAITAIKQAFAAPTVQEHVAWGYIDEYGEVQKFKNPSAHKRAAYENFQLLYTTPPAQPAPVQPVQETVGKLILGGVISTSEGTEYEEWDVEWNTKAVETLQEKLVTSNRVTLMLYTTPDAEFAKKSTTPKLKEKP